MKIAGVTVLYNPGRDVEECIRSYLDGVDTLFVVDNSERPDGALVERLSVHSNIRYLRNDGNQGLAHALNRGARQAIAIGATWLLMMDQDSRFAAGAFTAMVADAAAVGLDQKDWSLFVPRIVHGDDPAPAIVRDRYLPVLTAWTSGSLLSLRCYEDVGPFLESLFIDSIDHEYCLRMRSRGHEIVRLNQIALHHRLGGLATHRLLGRSWSTTHHSPVRRYYITRNRLHVALLYRRNFPDFFRRELKAIASESFKVLLLEKKRWSKLCAMGRGLRDSVRGVLRGQLGG